MTAFDVGVGILVLISAILATARGLTREVLSLATWAGSAAVAAYMYFYQKDIARGLITEPIIADVATVIVSFIVALVIFHLLTMWIADLVVDSKIGPLDRTLGFLFGIARGVVIAIVAVIFANWLLSANMPDWLRDSKTRPYLESYGDALIQMLPPDLENQVTEFLRRGEGGDESGPAEPADPNAAPSPDETTDELEDGSVPNEEGAPADEA